MTNAGGLLTDKDEQTLLSWNFIKTYRNQSSKFHEDLVKIARKTCGVVINNYPNKAPTKRELEALLYAVFCRSKLVTKHISRKGTGFLNTAANLKLRKCLARLVIDSEWGNQLCTK